MQASTLFFCARPQKSETIRAVFATITEKDLLAVRALLKVQQGLVKKSVAVNRPDIDVSLQDGGGCLYVSLINASTGKESSSYNYLHPICDVTVTIRGDYQSVELAFGEEFTWKKGDGCVEVCLKRL